MKSTVDHRSYKYPMRRFRLFRENDYLQYHSTLNPALWQDDQLKPRVRERLLAFGRAWGDFAKIPESAVRDVLMTGGNCNYNWSPWSDIDVHLLVDRASLGRDRGLVDDLLKAKKKLWSLEHHVTVEGYPIEPYAQDVGEPSPAGQGVYSLSRGAWVIHPELHAYDLDDPALAAKISHYAGLIDHLVDHGAPPDEFANLKRRIADMRKSGIARGGEFAPENLTFKALRNSGHLQKMTDYVRDHEDRSLSL